MIHIFRYFETNTNDFLEFTDEDSLVEVYKTEHNPYIYNWTTMPIEIALKSEESIIEHQKLKKMVARGDKAVIQAVIAGKKTWYSPSGQYSHGIPSERSVAFKYFTDPAQYFQVTTQHHEVFDVLKDERFNSLSKRVFFNILKLVKDSKCNVRLDKYLNYNLKKLQQYGVTLPPLTGTYVDVKERVLQENISCEYYDEFFHKLIDICIDKELELLGEHQIHEKKFN